MSLKTGAFLLLNCYKIETDNKNVSEKIDFSVCQI